LGLFSRGGPKDRNRAKNYIGDGREGGKRGHPFSRLAQGSPAGAVDFSSVPETKWEGSVFKEVSTLLAKGGLYRKGLFHLETITLLKWFGKEKGLSGRMVLAGNATSLQRLLQLRGGIRSSIEEKEEGEIYR